MRVVIDTNLWVSYLIHPNSPLNPVLDHVAAKHTLLYSSSTLAELAEVLTRPKFARYIEAFGGGSLPRTPSGDRAIGVSERRVYRRQS